MVYAGFHNLSTRLHSIVQSFVLHSYLNNEKTTTCGTSGYQKGMYKKIKGQDKVMYVKFLHGIGRKSQEQVVCTISKKEKSGTGIFNFP